MAISDKNIRITTNKNKATGFPNIVFTGSSAGTSVLTLEVRDDNTVAFTGLDGDVFSLDYNLSTGTIWSVNDKSGTPFLRASAGGTIGIAELGSAVLLGVGQSFPQYKLDVKGWAGFASSGDNSYTVLIENGASVGNNALSIRSANALRLYNSGNTFYTGFIGNQSGVNTTYTLPPTSPAVGTSVLQSTTGGTLTWVAMTSGSSSGTVNAGTATYAAYYGANGTAVSQNANLQFSGAGVSIGGNINSTTTSSGSLYVIGGLGVTGNAFIGGTTVITSNQASISVTSGALSVSGGMGLVGNAFIGGTVSITSNTASISSNSGALVVTNGLGVGGNAFIGATIYVPSASRSNIGSLVVSDNTSSTSTSTGAFLVTGGVGIVGNAFIGGTAVHTNSTSSIGTNSGSATFAGGIGIVGNAFIGGTVSITSNTASISSNSGALVVTNGLGVGGNAFIGATIYVPSTSRSNIGSLVVSDNTSSTSTATGSFIASGGFGLVGNAFIGGTVNITNNTQSFSPVSGSLVATGGAGFGQSVSIGGRLQLFNGANYTAFLSAASGNTTYTLPPATPTSIGASYLSASISGVMAWVPAPSGSGGSPAGSIGDIQLNSGLGAFTTLASNLNVSTTTGFMYHIGYNIPGNQGTANNAALLVGEGGAQTFSGLAKGTLLALSNTSGGGITYNYIDAQFFDGTNPQKSMFSVDYLGRTTISDLRITGSNATGTRYYNAFKTSTSQIGSSTYTLPLGGPAIGTSVLQCDFLGTMSWVPMVAGSTPTGAGSGTVAIPGAQYQVAAYYSGAGASVSGSSTFVNDLSASRVRITHTTPSSSTSTGALVVDGSVGVGGSLYTGGQINQTFQPTLGAAIDHALFMQSNPVQTNVGALIQIGSATKWDGTTAGFFNGSPGGTFLGINAASGNTADLLNFQENGNSVFSVGAGGTDVNFGPPIAYQATNLLASFISSVNSYNQVIIQNKSNGSSASADFVLNNDASTDTTFYGNLGINSSTFSGSGALAAPNATYLSATSGPLVLATTTQHPIRFAINGGATDVMYISESGTAISVFTNLGLRSQSDLRFWNTTNTQYGAIQGGNYSATYILTMPTAPVGTGFSVMTADSTGQMYFTSPGGGIAFSTVTGNFPTVRAKRPLTLQFASGFTPTAAGADSVVIRIPDNPSDGTSALTYVPREFYVRVETPSAGSSRIQLERSTGVGAFTLAATGSSYLGGLGLTISGAGIYVTSTTSFAGAFITSGDNLRLNWTLLNATHANFSVQLLLEEV